MEKPSEDNIEKATERVRSRMSLAQLRLIPKYKDFSKEDYNRLIRNAEKLSLIIFELYLVNNIQH